MMNVYSKSILIFFSLIHLPALTLSAEKVSSTKQKSSFIEYDWESLIPDVEKRQPLPPQAPVAHQGAMQAPQVRGQVRTDLNNSKVKIPGYAVPLKGDKKTITEFLLVPYMGACVHMPPPPTNQVILVTYPKGAPTDLLYDAIWVKGTLKTIENKHFAGVISGYHLDSEFVEEYNFEVEQMQ